MKLNEEQKELATKNIALALWMAKKWKATLPECDFNELVSLCYLGLTKAALHFEKDRVKFATFAGRCMQNEILLLLRRNRKLRREISLYDKICTDKKGNELLISDTLYQPETEVLMRDDMIQEVIEEALGYMRPMDKEVVTLTYFENKEQLEIGKQFSLSQSIVSRKKKRGLAEARKRFGKQGEDIIHDLLM